MSVIRTVFAIITLGVLTGAVLVLARPFGSVTQFRLERFARRQQLVITPTNGPRVIAYLQITRRWRTVGLLAGVGVDVVYGAAHDGVLHLEGLAVFAGWFVGAVVAEWRIGSGDRDGVRRAASLAPRRVSAYVPTNLSVLSVGAFAVVTGGTVAAVAVNDRHRLALGAIAVLSVAAAVVISAVARHVLTRPQAIAGADLVAADDALRSRSLHVLMGSGLAIAGYLLSVAAYLVWPAANPVQALAVIVLPVFGVIAATGTFDAAARHGPIGAPA